MLTLRLTSGFINTKDFQDLLIICKDVIQLEFFQEFCFGADEEINSDFVENLRMVC